MLALGPGIFHRPIDPPQLLVKLWQFFAAGLRRAFPSIQQRSDQWHDGFSLGGAQTVALRHHVA
jgi:hypothetical protein